MRVVAIGPCALAVTVQLGCGQDCTNVGCVSEAALALAPAEGESWADGDYTLTLRAANASYDCSFEVIGRPINPLSTGGGPPCSPDLELYMERDSSESDDWYVLAFLPGTPEEAEVMLFRNGALLLERTQQFSYERVRPNGPDCPADCGFASARLVFSPS